MSRKFPPLKRENSGLAYYHFPAKYPLYKATDRLDEHGSLTLKSDKLYFFGLKNKTPEYLEDYEEKYGIIFEFVTTKPYKLLAMDDEETQRILHENAPSKIQHILEKHYGLNPKKIRDSDSEPDRELSKYLCKEGYQGYAIRKMATDKGGVFHPELMICNSDGIKLVKQVTIQEDKVRAILEKGILKKREQERLEAKKVAKEKHREERRYAFVSPVGALNFGDDDNETSPMQKTISSSRLNFDTNNYSLTTPTGSPSKKQKMHSTIRSPKGGKKSKTRKNICARK